MSPTTVVPKTKVELGLHKAGVAVDGLFPQTEALERFSEELEARLEQLEARWRSFQTPVGLRKALRG
jgi:hypothetical protein